MSLTTFLESVLLHSPELKEVCVGWYSRKGPASEVTTKYFILLRSFNLQDSGGKMGGWERKQGARPGKAQLVMLSDR